jgi:ABC-2 type transport system permease protein
MSAKKPAKNQRQKQALVRLGLMAAILICINVLASYFHAGIDLTKEKRFTLTEPTKKMLRNMNDVAVIDVYLKGKFSAELQRMQEAVSERLRSFKDFGGNKIVFRFIDPMEGKNDAEQKQVAQTMQQRGMPFMQLSTKDEEEYSMKIFFPYALVQYRGKEMPIFLLENTPSKTPAEQIGYAEASLEYKFASAINQLSKPEKSRIAYVMGNDEELGIKTVDMLYYSLNQTYRLDTIDLTHSLHISNYYDAIVIYQPKKPFTGPDKLKIDQYIMRGGHVLWVVNNLTATLDSFQNSPQFIAMDRGLELDDMLFKYGVRVNKDLLEDMQCLGLSRVLNGVVEAPKSWIYFPRLNPTSEHPIVRNMDFVRGGFTNTIDTIQTPGIKKTILLQSSKYSRKAVAPARVSLSMMNYPMKNEMFTKSYLPVAVLLEGQFRSMYQGILAPEYLRLLDSLKEPFKPQCDSPTSQIVTSVGEIFTSDYSQKDGVLPMGYYRPTGEFFANKNFLLNCMEYLTDKSGILEARSKDVKLRLLDMGRVKEEKTMWQALNVGIPIAVVLIFASCYFFFRKRRYEIKHDSIKPSAHA